MLQVLPLQTFYKEIQQSPGDNENEYGHFNIFRIEDMVLTKDKKASYSRRSFYKLTLINGQSKIHYVDRDVNINGSAIVFSNPSIQYYWEIISEKQIGFMCIFTESFIGRFADMSDFAVFKYAGMAAIPLSQEHACTYEVLLLKMFTELQGNYRGKYDLMRCLLMEVIHEAQKIAQMPKEPLSKSNAAERIATEFMELMERQFPIELTYQVLKLTSPAAFAAQLNIHVNHLNKAVKAIKGQPTSELINERILQEAKTLLQRTNWTISEISLSLGFSEANHFSFFFKRLSKTTATSYRKNK